MNQLDNPFKDALGKKPSCMEMLQVIIDGDATTEQETYFKNHMDECMPCYRTYQLDMTIRALIKSKCCGNHVPEDLITRIKNQINA
jgi:mycothiol system anti-sigma-R factor